MTLPRAPEHVSFDTLKALSARLIALPIFRRANPSSVEGELLRRFCVNVADVDASRRTSALSDFLDGRLEIVEAHVKSLTPSEQAALAAKLTALRQAVAASSCTACAGSKVRRCNGRSARNDDAQIDKVGLCLGVFR